MTEPGYKPLLSILIPTMARREERFLKLVSGLLSQAEMSPAPIEVVGLQNQGERTLAEYREMLLRDARGTYLCFIDDDDEVPEYYIGEIVTALASEPDVVTFWQHCTGTAASLTLFGLQFLGAPWYPVVVNGQQTYLRTFSHVQPVLAEVARQGSFLRSGALGFTQEDQFFAQSVVPVLLQRGSKEYHISKIMYSYLWMSAGESTQQGRQPKPAGPHDPPVIESPCFRWY